jgi:L-rhamnonate dehydratase
MSALSSAVTGVSPGARAAQIRRVSYRRVFVPFEQEIHWSAGTRPGTTRIVVEIETDEGLRGLGETICLLEFVEPVLANTIIPLVTGEDSTQIERITKKIEGAGYYHHKRAMVAALCGLEMALWDLAGKRAGLPLHQLWGGSFRGSVPMIGYLQSNDYEKLSAEASRLYALGFRTFKVKIGMSRESDIELVRTVRESVGKDAQVRADVNGAWTIGTAKRQLKKLEPFDLEYIEQPLPLEDLQGHAYLRKITSIPVALDESAYTLQDVMAIIRAEAADVILLDPHEAGGLLATKKAAAVAEAAGVPVTLHSGAELGVSTAANMHLAIGIPNLLLAVDSQYHNQKADVITQPFQYVEGSLRPPDGPGLGVELDYDLLDRYETDRIRNPYLDPAKPGWFPSKPQY